MADIAISALPASTTPGDDSYIPMVVDGVTVKVKKSDFLAAVDSALSGKLNKSGEPLVTDKLRVAGSISLLSDQYVGVPGLQVQAAAIGFNLDRDANGTWTARNNGNGSGGGVLFVGISDGALRYARVTSAGATDQTFTDAELFALSTVLVPAP